MKRPTIILAIALATAPTLAFADTTSTVPVGPLYTVLVSYLLPLITALTPIFVGIALTIYQKRTGIQITQADRDAIQTACTNAAGRIIAGLEPAAMNMKIDVGSPMVAKEADVVVSRLPDVMQRLGLGPADVTKLVVGKLGQLQAQVTPVAAAASAPSLAPVSMPGGH